MDRFDRIYALHKILGNARYPVSRKEIQERIECSRATFTRIVEDLRDFLGAPIVYDRKYNGYRYDNDETSSYELPGLWFTGPEIEALLACRELLKDVQPGLLDAEIRPLFRRINQILKSKRVGSGELSARVRILRSAARSPDDGVFSRVAEAVSHRKRLKLAYHGREKNTQTDREVSPQRLIYYRDNWYLDGWCHLRKGLRSFSLDRIQRVEFISKSVKNVSDKSLDDFYGKSYGIFGGKPKQTAILRFSKEITPWIEKESLHPKQLTHYDGGHLIMEIPFGDPRELLMDILSYGDDVEVLQPASLRKRVSDTLASTLEKYRYGQTGRHSK